MSARDNILGRLRAAPRTPLPEPDVAPLMSSRSAGLRASSSLRLAAFKTVMAAFHGEIHDTTAADWPALVARLCREKGIRSLACPPEGELPERLALEPELPELWRFTADMETVKGTLFDTMDAGITRARSAIAETGTLIAWTGPQEPRSLSLVPPIHFVLLEGSRIYADLLQAMSEEGWAQTLPTNLLLISGPSKTADIQQTLAYGAHGPKELIVLVLDAEGDTA